MKKYCRHIKRFLLDEEGVTAIEYALIGSLIAVVIVGAVTEVGASVQTLFLNVASQIEAVVARVF